MSLVTVQSGTVFHGRSEGGRLGYAVSTAGDIDGDGFVDLVFGAPRTSYRPGDGLPLTVLAGEAILVSGQAGGFAPTVALGTPPAGLRMAVFQGSQAYAQFGTAIAGGGDIDGDGHDDLLAGTPFRDDGVNTDAGAAYVIFGSGAAMPDWQNGAPAEGTVSQERVGETVRSYAGFSVAIVGDLNGDGIADAATGMPGASLGTRFGAGAVELRFAGIRDRDSGGADAGESRVRIWGEAPLDYAGASVAPAGDVNGDGLADLILGAPLAAGAASGSGAAYVIFGRQGGFSGDIDLAQLAPSEGVALRGAATGERAGVSVAAAGDLNGDGIGDLVLGAPGSGAAGAAYVIFGNAAGLPGEIDLGKLDGTNGFRIDGVAAGDFFGSSVAGVGDVNGDGRDDILVGAPGMDRPGAADAGGAVLIFGTGATTAAAIWAGGLPASDAMIFRGARSHDGTGIAVAAAGDLNGDGWRDLMIGADQADPGGRYEAGAVYLVHGGPGILAGLDASDGSADGRILLSHVGADVLVESGLVSPPPAGDGPSPENPPEEDEVDLPDPTGSPAADPDSEEMIDGSGPLQGDPAPATEGQVEAPPPASPDASGTGAPALPAGRPGSVKDGRAPLLQDDTTWPASGFDGADGGASGSGDETGSLSSPAGPTDPDPAAIGDAAMLLDAALSRMAWSAQESSPRDAEALAFLSLAPDDARSGDALLDLWDWADGAAAAVGRTEDGWAQGEGDGSSATDAWLWQFGDSFVF